MGADKFTPEAAARLEGPEWLRKRRTGALDRSADLPEPTTQLEEWRYSRIDELDLGRYDLDGSVPAPTDAGDPPAVAEVLAELGELDGLVVLRNGRVQRTFLSEQATSAGVVHGIASATGGATAVGEDLASAVLGSAMEQPLDRFAALNDAFSPDPVVVSVPRGVTLEHPIAVISLLDEAAAGKVFFPRVSILAGENSESAFVEVAVSDDVEALAVPVTEISLGRAARVRYSAVQELGTRVWQLGSFIARVDADATLDAAVAALGGDYARLRLDCHLVGRGSTGNLSSVYFGDGDQTLDLRTFQEHVAPDTVSNLLFKGALADRSHSVYTGMIRIHPDARNSNAFQTNRNLKLSEDAWAESVPNLEIENNDVRCSHASTVGPVDPEQRFYLESRGVPTEVADRLVVAGFFDEVLDVFPERELGLAVGRRIDELLDRLVTVPASRRDDGHVEASA